MNRRRVVITGMGAVTPLGMGVDRFWDGLIEGRSGVRSVTLFPTEMFEVRFGGECTDFKLGDFIDRKSAKRLDRFSQMALQAAHEAIHQAGLNLGSVDPHRIGVILGSGIGGLKEIEDQHYRLLEKGPDKVSAFTIPRLMVNAAAGNISMEFGIKGVSQVVATACASAANAMGDAVATIRAGIADAVVTGGTEAALTPLGLSAFAAMKALSCRNDEPHRASRPFDRDRDGFVLAEGAGVLVFEELEFARKRGAHILAEVAGYGASSDAGHITQPLETGDGAAAAMRACLRDAGMNADEIDYINAHGTSTPLGDLAETMAIKAVFGPTSRNLVVSSTKSSVGHLLGASGGVEMIACVLSLANSVVPPTINLEHPSEGCDLDYVPNTARDMPVRAAMNNSFGFGGHNATLIVKRFP
ncbi:MAG: beta-ketoacyl-ACP synthase II [Phycisphaerae bacterium]|nr:MAG: beta-ketoacyl-[acyl-carrier-protein] synthase II [Planctomycetota bacterium]KAB2947650.1 MAG: beta-ketoacyl-ACP synthase II [Phycisphaerae bacterium]MBE7455982.1 beta-ketoacyl-ACP synthase II [Planctomycetia bacterium]MCK6465109.1 beta-ketoacyl-ACP synthase II [Phycisphaerae bacterium]MCL4717240.1 beta-ketoacyl-ACP synthase II [Phycisphaerae bacterium]